MPATHSYPPPTADRHPPPLSPKAEDQARPHKPATPSSLSRQCHRRHHPLNKQAHPQHQDPHQTQTATSCPSHVPWFDQSTCSPSRPVTAQAVARKPAQIRCKAAGPQPRAARLEQHHPDWNSRGDKVARSNREIERADCFQSAQKRSRGEHGEDPQFDRSEHAKLPAQNGLTTTNPLTDEPLAEFISLREFNGIRGSGGTGVRLRLE